MPRVESLPDRPLHLPLLKGRVKSTMIIPSRPSVVRGDRQEFHKDQYLRICTVVVQRSLDAGTLYRRLSFDSSVCDIRIARLELEKGSLWSAINLFQLYSLGASCGTRARDVAGAIGA